MSATMNRIGLPRDAYKGAATTLCAGCGHNSITNHMIKALYELGIEPHRLAKMSGIGCSSKTPAYFVETAHGFNGVHGRMPAAARDQEDMAHIPLRETAGDVVRKLHDRFTLRFDLGSNVRTGLRSPMPRI